ncbi:hypothetical protein CSKR_105375 [Clonorchis sinensis]|uniref:Uncharacterized protein n=1 Tax=Clonorchis sinensis TaxID=79923 RepID=A0A3R7D6S8_CLOSI|nr:hypothetical protein CSKR_105375 [Clonorchis sinensis]
MELLKPASVTGQITVTICEMTDRRATVRLDKFAIPGRRKVSLVICSPSLAIGLQTFRHHTRRHHHHQLRTDGVSSYGDETFASQLPSSANRSPATRSTTNKLTQQPPDQQPIVSLNTGLKFKTLQRTIPFLASYFLILFLVVDQMAVCLFVELGNWLAGVSSPVEETSSVHS